MPFVIGTSPILPIPILWLLLIAFVAIQVFAFLKSKKINIFHALAFLTMLIFALNPQIIDIVKKDRPQKIIIIKDYSASMMASGRFDGINVAAQNLKKQIAQNKNLEIIEGEIAPNNPVSYTHLDVYKRQLKKFMANLHLLPSFL